jgi:hypothetical protein
VGNTSLSFFTSKRARPASSSSFALRPHIAPSPNPNRLPPHITHAATATQPFLAASELPCARVHFLRTAIAVGSRRLCSTSPSLCLMQALWNSPQPPLSPVWFQFYPSSFLWVSTLTLLLTCSTKCPIHSSLLSSHFFDAFLLLQ